MPRLWFLLGLQIWVSFLHMLTAAAAAAKSLQSCLTLCDPIDGSLPGSSVLGILQNAGVGCHFLLQCMKVKSESEVAQSCLTLHDPMDCSPPGSSIHGSFQARVLEWGAIAFSNTCSLAICQNSLLGSFRVPIGDQPWGVGWCEWGTKMSLAYLGRFAYEKSQGLIDGPPSGVIIRILFLWCFPNPDCCSSSCSLSCKVVQLKAQDSTWSERETDIFGSVLDN